MGLRICHDEDAEVCCLYCSTSGWAFGRTFEGADCLDEAEHFLEWSDQLPDPRKWSNVEMESRYDEWFKATHNGDGVFVAQMADAAPKAKAK